MSIRGTLLIVLFAGSAYVGCSDGSRTSEQSDPNAGGTVSGGSGGATSGTDANGGTENDAEAGFDGVAAAAGTMGAAPDGGPAGSGTGGTGTGGTGGAPADRRGHWAGRIEQYSQRYAVMAYVVGSELRQLTAVMAVKTESEALCTHVVASTGPTQIAGDGSATVSLKSNPANGVTYNTSAVLKFSETVANIEINDFSGTVISCPGRVKVLMPPLPPGPKATGTLDRAALVSDFEPGPDSSIARLPNGNASWIKIDLPDLQNPMATSMPHAPERGPEGLVDSAGALHDTGTEVQRTSSSWGAESVVGFPTDLNSSLLDLSSYRGLALMAKIGPGFNPTSLEHDVFFSFGSIGKGASSRQYLGRTQPGYDGWTPIFVDLTVLDPAVLTQVGRITLSCYSSLEYDCWYDNVVFIK
jgi:hypothetical protein